MENAQSTILEEGHCTQLVKQHQNKSQGMKVGVVGFNEEHRYNQLNGKLTKQIEWLGYNSHLLLSV